jgi:hypothetical protein
MIKTPLDHDFLLIWLLIIAVWYLQISTGLKQTEIHESVLFFTIPILSKLINLFMKKKNVERKERTIVLLLKNSLVTRMQWIFQFTVHLKYFEFIVNHKRVSFLSRKLERKFHRTRLSFHPIPFRALISTQLFVLSKIKYYNCS